MNSNGFQSLIRSIIIVLAAATIILIAGFQTVTNGQPDQYTLAAVLTLALGGGLGRAVDTAVKVYVQSQIDAVKPKSKDPNESDEG